MFKKTRKMFLFGFASLLFLSGSFGLLSQEAPVSSSDNPALLDPTKPSDFVGGLDSGKTQRAGMLRLEAIIISDTKRVAIINQKILVVGDSIGSKKVIAVEDDKVVLREGKGKDQKDIVLPLFDNKMKDEVL